MFLLPEHAVNAYTSLDQSIFQGRILQVVPARDKPKSKEDNPTGPVSFKSKRAKNQQSNSSNDFNWNSLFMNSDTVAESMAKKLGVRKHEILNPESDNMAVRLALAETNIINDTKEYLTEQGVSLIAFTSSQRKNRSCNVVLVKNIPYSTCVDDLTETFGKFGTLGRVSFIFNFLTFISD